MNQALDEVERALRTLGKDPWSDDIKASEDFLGPLFEQFYSSLKVPNLIGKTDYHVLAAFVPADKISSDIRRALDKIVDVAKRARPRGNE